MPKDNKKELFYWVDEKDEVLGSITRQEAHSGSRKIHRASGVILENGQGDVLLQKRSPDKDKYPGQWCLSASGHVTFGGSYAQTAIKETQEEIGIMLNIQTLQLLGKFLLEGEAEQEYVSIFSAKADQTPTQLDADEVAEVKWVPKTELSQFAQENTLTPITHAIFVLLGMIETK